MSLPFLIWTGNILLARAWPRSQSKAMCNPTAPNAASTKPSATLPTATLPEVAAGIAMDSQEYGQLLLLSHRRLVLLAIRGVYITVALSRRQTFCLEVWTRFGRGALKGAVPAKIDRWGLCSALRRYLSKSP